MKQKSSPRILLSFAAKHYPKLYGVMWSLYVIMVSSFLLSHVTKREIHNATVIFFYLEMIVLGLTVFSFLCYHTLVKKESLRNPSHLFYLELIELLIIGVVMLLMSGLSVAYNNMIAFVFGLGMMCLVINLRTKYILVNQR